MQGEARQTKTNGGHTPNSHNTGERNTTTILSRVNQAKETWIRSACTSNIVTISFSIQALRYLFHPLFLALKVDLIQILF